MKINLKHNPFFHMAIVLLALLVILIISAIGMFYYVFAIPEPEGLSLAGWPNTFTDNLSIWIECKDDTVRLEKLGVERLEEYGLWAQIVDETGKEVFSYKKPECYPEKYSIAELLSLSESKFENENTVFVNSVQISNKSLTYLVGFPYAIGKYTLYYNGENVARLSPLVQNVILVAACLIVFCAFAYAFWLSRKLSKIIGGIKNVSLYSYAPMKEKGIFAEINSVLNKMDTEVRHSRTIQEETDRNRKEWIANITHDLKTPLSPIKGYAELLADNRFDSKTAQEYGVVILKNTNYIENLINDLKFTYQLEAGAIPYAPQKLKIIRFLKELVIDIANDPSFCNRRIEFESDMQEQVVAYDPDLLRRGVQNIIINALIHNSVDTNVKVSVKKTSLNSLSISVSDNGKGMSEAELSDLWSRYYRGKSTEEKPEGSGLGLAISKQIITLHGGDIEVNSSLDTGTEFIITLPLDDGELKS